MKIWTSEHVFNHPWETVVTAAWRKYPNPMNPNVIGMDVVDRQITSSGSLRSHRLLSSEWPMPGWAMRLVGAQDTMFASEHSEVDPKSKTMTLLTKNLTFTKELSVVEKLTYAPHPSVPESTLLTQEAVVHVHGVPLVNFMENFVTTTISGNATKGRQAIEWVIGRINSEIDDLARQTVKGIESIGGDLKNFTASHSGHHHHHQAGPQFLSTSD